MIDHGAVVFTRTANLDGVRDTGMVSRLRQCRFQLVEYLIKFYQKCFRWNLRVIRFNG